MEQFLPYTAWITSKTAFYLNWLNEHVVVWSTLVQAAIILAIWLATRLLAEKSAGWLERILKPGARKSIIRIHASPQELLFLFYFAVFLWFSFAAVQDTAVSSNLIKITASLVTAWGVIRLTSSVIESPFWSRLIAILLWVLAALNIVGWLTPAITIMDKAAINIGDFKLSLLLVFKSLLAFAILLWAVGLLSGVMERSFNKATGLTPSQQVLFFKLSNISLYVLAVIIGLNLVGLDLTTLTVFSGALGLGIGFGLQKIVSNLLSGIILLLDKSVKPGDVIVVGGTYGWVNSLGARCVSVLTRDGKEYLIPNENLILQEVENWSYSNNRVRLRIPIGVAYLSDIALVKKLLLQAVDENPRILKIPKPNCLITGFGDNSIDHELRAWITDPAEGVANVTSEIYYRVWELFQEHGVEIPFPQRDVHMKLDENSPLFQLLMKALEKNAAATPTS